MKNPESKKMDLGESISRVILSQSQDDNSLALEELKYQIIGSTTGELISSLEELRYREIVNHDVNQTFFDVLMQRYLSSDFAVHAYSSCDIGMIIATEVENLKDETSINTLSSVDISNIEEKHEILMSVLRGSVRIGTVSYEDDFCILHSVESFILENREDVNVEYSILKRHDIKFEDLIDRVISELTNLKRALM